MSRQPQYHDDDPEAQYAGQHDSYYEQEYDPRGYDPRQSARSDGQYADYEDGRYSANGGYYEGSDVGDGYYNQQRGTYASEDSRADYYRQDAYADDYPDAYPAGVDPYAGQQYYQDQGRGYDRKGKRNGSSEDDSESFSDFTMRSDMARAAEMDVYRDERYYGGRSTDSLSQMGDRRGYGRPPSSQISYGGNRSSGASTPIYGMDYPGGFGSNSREPYPAWTTDNQIPLSKEEIESIFQELQQKFGFQMDSVRNMFDHMMVLLDSRASRMTPNQALLSLHADFIGGENANYRKWYFAAQLDVDDAVGLANVKLGKTNKRTRKARAAAKKARGGQTDERSLEDLEGDYSLEAAEYRWKTKMNQMSQHDRARQLALYLCCWGEANQVRFMPECLCFIFKCCDDYLRSPECQSRYEPLEEGFYLNNVITPIYMYIRDQGYEIYQGKYVRREKDHNNVVGYDDINQLFWYAQGIERIVLQDKTRLIDIPPSQRYFKFNQVEWKKVFFKTYKETRSWFHMATNFNRIWIIHITVFWYYTAFNSPTLLIPDYKQTEEPNPTGARQWASVALGGAVTCLIMILATIAEWAYVPRRFAGAQPLLRRFMILIVLFVINIAPSVYIFGFVSATQDSSISLTIGIVNFFISLATFLFFAIMPIGALTGNLFQRNPRRFLANKYFTANYPRLKGNDMYMSYGLWVLVFAAKFAESYAFLTLSLRDPIRILSIMQVNNCSDIILKNYLCQYQAKILLGMMYVTDLVLFFLDTYLWYIIWNCVFSVARSFYLGISIWTPWRNVFSRLPKRIYSKVLATVDMEIKYKPKVLISQIWNAIVISMYREHLLSIDHVQKLLYHQVPSEQEGKRTLRAPTFFVSQEDHSFRTEFFPSQSEAERRISFFAQSLSTPIPEPAPVDNMPTFTVLVPHYSEKILLSLREIIREEDQLSRVTLLEYLKQLHPVEWDCFVKDTKVLAEETAAFDGTPFEKDEKDTVKSKIDDLPFYCIGFKSAAPEYTLRTRIWASLRSQTLYRTVSGFMNYPRAIKLLYRVENPEVVQMFGGNSDKLDRELERMARRKFKFVISMQRYSKFTPEERENTEFILRAYPDLQIAYLDEEPPTREGEEARIYSALIDGHCELMENGMRRPKFRIQLSGNPILGDGKSDNQNHAIIFYRGEYIQLIDANQDNYLEECLKIRSVLAEFEEMNVDPVSPYTPGYTAQDTTPVAILGAREYIFSENVGILGDVAAGKEQTFGTLFARTLAQIGGKLHYGHPDFLNGVFMTTRGGVSKAQKGLHLNEDIYAGMNALLRGGRIKHCEYYQCGKGRDMGFGSILNFTTKIGTGMGEQMLSREYYYMGTQLPLDRFLSFYYAHPGFHVNNLFIILSVQLFMLVLLNLGALRHETISCNLVDGAPFTDPLKPDGCYNTDPIMSWVKRCILNIFIVFFVAFVPLIIQELTERGFWRAARRFVKHIGSLSPLFEVFVCQIYANSILTNLSLGGARYIATGRGFATARIPFSILYSRFAGPSIYLGARSIMMLLFATMTVWIPHLIYFWVSLLALCVSPFVFNPHQFAWQDFFVDYREFIRWMSRGNSLAHENSWIGYCRLSRTRITGYKRKQLGTPSDKNGGDIPRAHFTNIFFSEIIGPFILVIFTLIPYCFINAQTGFIYTSDSPFPNAKPTNSLIRIAIIAFAPVAVNAGLLLGLFGMACCMGPCLMMCCKKFGSVLAAIGHAIAVLMLIIVFEVLWFLERWSISKALLGMIAVVAIQRFLFKALTCIFLTREFRHDESNRAWWTGKWVGSGLGAHAISQPGREYLCKIIELSLFAADFILSHILLFALLPILCIPYIDRWHSVILFWLRPSRQIRPPIFSMKQNRLRKRIVRRYATLYFIILVVFCALIVGPLVAGMPLGMSKADFSGNKVPTSLGGSLLSSWGLIQPNNGNPNQTMPDNLNASLSSSTSS